MAVTTVVTTAYFGVCLLLEHFFRRTDGDEDGGEIHVTEVWRPLMAIQLALMVVAAYIYGYDTLEDAAISDDLVQVEKRLNWNLEGLGPNNSLVVNTGSGWLELFPLLPVAVGNSNYEMVKLLVERGAELDPRDWDEEVRMPFGDYVKNPFYFAVKNHDVEMINLLIDLGANPDHGLYVALKEHDREFAEYFLEKGASLEFALDVAKQRGYSQQHIDQLSADYAPKSKVDTGQ